MCYLNIVGVPSEDGGCVRVGMFRKSLYCMFSKEGGVLSGEGGCALNMV